MDSADLLGWNPGKLNNLAGYGSNNGSFHSGGNTGSASPPSLLGSDARPPPGWTPPPDATDPSSVLLVQQNLQRIYGSIPPPSMNANHSQSRQSLHSILEDQATDALNFPPGGVRTTSDDDLFLMDQIQSSSGALAGTGPSTSPQSSTLAAAGGTGGMSVNHNLSATAAPGTIFGESRTLFIRGIDPLSSDDMIREYLECFGDIHSLYTASKHRGYVMVTYHDVRASRLAQNTIHGQTWRGSQLAAQFSAESGSGSGGVTAALLLVALDGGAILDDAFFMLSKYGELKELRREPNRPNIALAEYYDARHASAALDSLSGGVGGGMDGRKDLLVLDAGPSLANLPDSFADVASAWDKLGGSGGMHQPVGVHDINRITESLGGLSVSQQQQQRQTAADADAAFPGLGLETSQQQQQQQQQQHSGLNGGNGGGRGGGMSSSMLGQYHGQDMLAAAGLAPRPPAYPLRGISSTGSLSLWAQSNQQQQQPYQQQQSLQAALNSAAAAQQQQQQQQGALGSSPLQNGWVGPPPGLQQDLLIAQQQAAALAMLQQNAARLQLQQQQAAQNAVLQAALQQSMLNQQAAAAVAALGLQVNARRGFSEPALGGRLARRPMDPAAEAERRAQQERLYGLDLARIAAGEDRRTTLMIKNIPNKYTQKMLLTLMEERFARFQPFPFDFFYLPIDFKNRCNVGYAFINMTTPHAIPTLVEEFHGRRWPKFNSEKVCRIAYARIQGKNALVQHFQNSSLLHEDKRCRPVLFGPNGEVEIFPMSGEVGGGGEGGGAGVSGSSTPPSPDSS